MRGQKLGMILKRLLSVLVLAKALVLRIVVHSVSVALPLLMAFDAKVVPRLARQSTVARTRLKKSLRECNRSRNLMRLHLANGDILVGLDVFFWGDALGSKRQRQ